MKERYNLPQMFFGYKKNDRELIVRFQFKGATLSFMSDFACQLDQLEGLTITKAFCTKDSEKRYSVGLIASGPAVDINRLISILDELRITKVEQITLPNGSLDREGLVQAIKGHETALTTTGVTDSASTPTAFLQHWETDMKLDIFKDFLIFRIVFKDTTPDLLESIMQSLGEIFSKDYCQLYKDSGEIVLCDLRYTFEKAYENIKRTLMKNGVALTGNALCR